MNENSMLKLLEYKIPGAIVRRLVGAISHVAVQGAVIALTFDDGPHPDSTPRLLDILEKYQAHATFFMVGQATAQYPKLVQQVAEGGHEIGNHTWDHVPLPLITGPERHGQIEACAKAIAPFGQKLFRPPYGYQNIASHIDILRLGYQTVTWNLVAYDWLDYDAVWLTNHLLSKIKPGSIILLHDRLYHTLKPHYANREPMLNAVNMLLAQLNGQFRFVTISDLLEYGRPQRQNWYRQADVKWLNELQKQI